MTAARPATPGVVPPDPRWPALFTAERGRVVAAAAPVPLDVHHVGSTAVPGMPAKPVIDMIAGVADLSAADDLVPLLRGLGYARRPHRLDAVAFAKDDGRYETHHLHLTVPGSALWRERLAFRDALRRDPALVREYAALKERLLHETGGQPYTAEGKREFVRRVLAGVGVDLVDGLHDDGRAAR